MLQDTEDEQGVLGGEDSTEQGAGQGRAKEAGGNGMALHHGVGVRVEAIETGRDAGVYSLYAEPHLAARPSGKSRSLFETGRRGHADADGGGK